MGIHLQLQMKTASACIIFMLLVHAPDNTLLLTAGAYEPLHGTHKLLLTVINPCVSGPVRSKGFLVWSKTGNKATYACFDSLSQQSTEAQWWCSSSDTQYTGLLSFIIVVKRQNKMVLHYLYLELIDLVGNGSDHG